MEPARPPVPGVGVGCLLHPGGQPLELRERNGGQSSCETASTPAVYGGEAGPKKNKKGKSTPNHQPIYAWTDLTYLLHKNHVSWGYYVVSGTEPDCENDAAETCAPVAQNSNTPGIWNPLPWFDTVKADNQLGNIQDVDQVLRSSQEGNAAGGVVGRPIG